MILSCNNITKSFDGNTILNNCSFNVDDNEKVAIVGINGAGKSTFFKIITKQLSADNGVVTLAKDKVMSYLSQHPDMNSNRTIYEEMLDAKKDIIETENTLREMESRMSSETGDTLNKTLESYTSLSHQFEIDGGLTYKSEINGVLKGLGFTEDDYDRNISSLSGGQKTRVYLSKILLSSPDIILLDEPTNHLDLNSIVWLEQFLSNYKGAVVIISHDRYFLDKIVTKVVDIENTVCSVYSGNFSEYSKKKALRREAELKAYMNQQREIQHQEAVIDKLKQFNREKSIKRAESREKKLDKIELLDKPINLNDEMRINLTPSHESGKDVLIVENLSKSFDDNHLFSNLNFNIRRGEKVGILGNNGTGKTTLLKIINDIITADQGKIQLGANVTIGYYDQEQHILKMDNTIFDEISDARPEMTNTQIRNLLAAFLFTGDDVYKLISELSGGERARVSLAKLMLSNANFLILDEPTNHLDIVSKEILENAINNYSGTVLYVSHDRYFINKTATRILELTGKTLVNYIGDYNYYLEKREELTKIYAPESHARQITSNSTAKSDSALDWQKAKEEKALKQKKEKELKNTEAKINELEEKSGAITEKMYLPEYSSDAAKLLEFQKELDSINAQLEELYSRWEELI